MEKVSERPKPECIPIASALPRDVVLSNYPPADVSLEHLTRGHEELLKPFMAEISTIAPVHDRKIGLSVTKISGNLSYVCFEFSINFPSIMAEQSPPGESIQNTI